MAKKIYPTTAARLDADKTAKPLSRIVGHARAGDCIGPGNPPGDEYRDEEGNSVMLNPGRSNGERNSDDNHYENQANLQDPPRVNLQRGSPCGSLDCGCVER